MPNDYINLIINDLLFIRKFVYDSILNQIQKELRSFFCLNIDRAFKREALSYFLHEIIALTHNTIVLSFSILPRLFLLQLGTY